MTLADQLRRTNAEKFLQRDAGGRKITTHIEPSPAPSLDRQAYLTQKLHAILLLYPGEWASAWTAPGTAISVPLDEKKSETIARQWMKNITAKEGTPMT